MSINKSSLSKRIKIIFKKFISLIKIAKNYLRMQKDGEIVKSDIVIFSYDVDRSDIVDGLAFSKILDPLINQLSEYKLRVLNLGYPGCKLTGEKTYGNVVSFGRAYVRNEIIKKIKELTSKKSNLKNDSFYYKLLKKIQPKLILGIGVHSELCMEARKLEIPIWEVSHGFGYNPPPPWGWKVKSIPEMPNGILVYDEKSEKTFSEIKNLEVKIVKHPLYQNKDLQINYYTKDINSNVGKLKEKIEKKKVILVIITWGYAGDHGEYEQLKGVLRNGFFPEAIETAMVEMGEDFFWLFRVHPAQITNKEKYANLFNKLSKMTYLYGNMEWIISSTMPIYTLLPLVSAQISMASMASYDAAIFGKKTLLMCPTVRPNQSKPFLFDDLLESGASEFIDCNDQEVLPKLKNWLVSSLDFPTDQNFINFDGLEKIGKVVADLVNQHKCNSEG